MVFKFLSVIILIILLSCSATKYTLAMGDHSGDYSRIDTIYAGINPPSSCHRKNDCIQLNVNDLNDFNENYEYERIIVFSEQKRDTINFNLLMSNLKNGNTKIDSIFLKNGNSVSAKSFIYGAGIGLVTFLIAPPLSNLETIGTDDKYMTYNSSWFMSSMLVCLFLSVGSDLVNREIMLYPVSRSHEIFVSQ